LRVAPNPFTDKIEVKVEGSNVQIAQLAVLNLVGTTLWAETIVLSNTNTYSLSLPGLPAGMYFIRISYQGSASMVKIIKQ
jgi:hypothetical protein